jgi:hypothetical protein
MQTCCFLIKKLFTERKKARRLSWKARGNAKSPKNQKKICKNLAVVLKYATSEFKSKLKLRDEFGKPKIETLQPYFLEAIVNIAMQFRSRKERINAIYRCILTIDLILT